MLGNDLVAFNSLSSGSRSIEEIEVPPEVLFQQELRAKHDHILAHPNVPWETFQQGGLLTAEDLALIRKYEGRSVERRIALFQTEPAAFAALLLKMATVLTNRESLQYSLTLLDDVLQADENNVAAFMAVQLPGGASPAAAVLRLLQTSTDPYTTSRICRILALFLSRGRCPEAEAAGFLRWVGEHVTRDSIEETSIAVGALMLLLRRSDLRLQFHQQDGLKLMAFLLKQQRSVQTLYQVIYCLWLLSFHPAIAPKFSDTPIIPRLVDLLKVNCKEKIQRVVFSTLRNLLGTGAANVQMLDSGLLKVLDAQSDRRWPDDDLKDDFTTLRDALSQNVVELSSWEVYLRELSSGTLTWSPVHRSERFWKENALRFEEHNSAVLRQLINVLASPDPSSVMVACYDLGELSRFHPAGKKLIERANGKATVMGLMTHPDAGVQKQALLAVQKIMVQHWEYLAAR